MCPKTSSAYANRHALFDDGGIYISDDLKVRNYSGDVIAPLHTTSKHSIGLEHLKYHRQLWAH